MRRHLNDEVDRAAPAATSEHVSQSRSRETGAPTKVELLDVRVLGQRAEKEQQHRQSIHKNKSSSSDCDGMKPDSVSSL